MPADLLVFMRSGIGAAISHGFILSLVVMAAGTLVALTVGSARPQKKPETNDEQQAVSHPA
ncbi:hypothetical protein [Paenibacillus sp. GCM10023250]|uniref:hypothetical protein n=1 Tax=Paenibacillus sp. GCM10023250 TaxID=3252648 RepID=UPI00361AC43E